MKICLYTLDSNICLLHLEQLGKCYPAIIESKYTYVDVRIKHVIFYIIVWSGCNMYRQSSLTIVSLF